MKCHTTVERLYHPDKYKRIFCDVGHIISRLILFRGADATNLKYALSITRRRREHRLPKSAKSIGRMLIRRDCLILMNFTMN